MRIYNIVSKRSGRAVANQFYIATQNGRYFQSYDTVIAFVPDQFSEEKVKLSAHWDCSCTTLKYLKQFLSDKSKAEIKDKLKNGEYELVDRILITDL